MGVEPKTATRDGVSSVLPLACTQCGAGIKYLTLDAQIIVTFRINSVGRIEGLKHRLPEKGLIERASEEGQEFKSMFCDECGHYMSIEYGDKGEIVGFTDKPLIGGKTLA
jgi:hypothetical protein